ncbi:MAG TPA: DNA polymerase domain-containing protein [Anaerolineae bacterium]|nr:DNA polymerase domain-containing protein [Anaerolineae bacterium]
MLLQAKEIVEDHGFEVLHQLIDSLWIKKRNTCDDEYPSLLAEITEKTGVPIALEGVYDWVAFLPSREYEKIGVPNRYFGVFRNGEIKTRGIELRRGDTAPWIKTVQQEAIELLAAAHNRKEYFEQVPQVIELIRDRLTELQSQQVDYRDLALTYRLTRDPHEYRHNTLNAIVARQLSQRGVSLHPGEAVRYVITDAQARDPLARARPVEFMDSSYGYDAEKYAELLLRAMATILEPAGLDQAQIEQRLTQPHAQPLVWQIPLAWFTSINRRDFAEAS